MLRHLLPVTLTLLSLLLLAPAARAQEKLTIAEIAPLDSFLVMTIPDWPGAKAALLRSEVGKLWSEPEVKAFVDAFMKEEVENQESGAGEVWTWFEQNVQLEDLREPTGAVGIALFPEPAKGDDAGADEGDEGESHEIMVLAVADFGDGAEAMMATMEDIFERLAKDGHIKLDDDDYDGTEIRIVTVIPKEPEPGEDGGEEFEDDDADDEPPQPMMLARSGSFIVASTSRRGLETAIDRAAGRPGGDSRLADNRTYAAALTQHPAGSHAMVVGVASDYIRGQIRDGLGAMLAAFAPPGGGEALVNALGIGAVEAFSFGLRIDTDAGVAEQTMGLLAPRKEGLLTLVDSRLESFTPPAFAPADAMNLYSVGFRFDRIPQLVRSVIAALPPEMQGQAGGVQAMVDNQAAPILNALAPELHVIQAIPRPFEPGERMPVIAVRLKDALTIANTINGFAPAMGLAPRDFEGNQIFQSEDPTDPALAIGFDHVFFGDPAGIENALRLASRPDAARLAGSDRFTRAAAAVGPGAAFYSFSNVAETIEHAYWQMENAEKIYQAEIAEWGLDEETTKDFLESFRDEQPKWMSKLPPLKTVLRHLGDTVTEFRPTPDGFRGRTVFLRP